MKVDIRHRRGTARFITVCALASSLFQFLVFAAWPGNPDWDVHHSVFAAENFLAIGKPLSINLYPDESDDLASHARIRWMTHWPPVHSWMYAIFMKSSFSPGGSTKLLALLAIVVGATG